MSDEKPEGEGGCIRGDVAYLAAPVIPGLPGIPVLRHTPDHQVSSGIVVPVLPGSDMRGKEVVRLSPREGGDGFDVETLYDGRQKPEDVQDGPAMVNSPRYLDGWDRIFGAKRGDSPN